MRFNIMVVDANLPGVYRYGMDESVDFPAIGLQYQLYINQILKLSN